MKKIKDFGMCQLLYLPPSGNFAYYLSEHGYIIFIAKEGSACSDGVFGDVNHFKNTFAEDAKYNDRYFTASGFKVIAGKDDEVFQMLSKK